MKKYEKPRIWFESLKLSQHIAGCSFTWNSDGTASGSITDVPKYLDILDGIQDGKLTYDSWFNDSSTCEHDAEIYCYTNGSFGSAAINS